MFFPTANLDLLSQQCVGLPKGEEESLQGHPALSLLTGFLGVGIGWVLCYAGAEPNVGQFIPSCGPQVNRLTLTRLIKVRERNQTMPIA